MKRNEINNLKVLHLGDTALVGYNLVKMLRDDGFIADYLSYENPNIDTKYEWCHSFKTRQTDNYNKTKIIKESLSFCRNYDIIHAHSIFSIPLLFINKPYVLHLHGTDTRVYAKKSTILGLGLRQLIKNANQIVVSTPDLIKEVSLFDRNSIFVPNPIDFNNFRPFKSSINLHEGADFVILHPSRHSSNKGNHFLINAFSEIVHQGYDAKLYMVEWGDLLYKSKNLVEELGIKKNVEWIHHIPQSQLADYYNASDIICDQFYLKGLGLVTFEAMACGKPLITKYNPKYVENGYLSPPPLPIINDEADVTQTLINLLDNNALRKNIGIENLKWIKKEHSQLEILPKLYDIYERINYK